MTEEEYMKPCECPAVGICSRFKDREKPKKMSTRAHQLCQTDSSYRKLWGKLSEGQPLEMPKIATKVVRLSDALSRWKEAGSPKRTAEEIKTIFETICFPCEQFIGNDKSGSCKACGCRLAHVGGLLNKIEMVTEECPLGKWGTGDESISSGISG